MHFRLKCCPQGIPTMPHTAWHPRPVSGLLVATSAIPNSQILYVCTIYITRMTPRSATKSSSRWNSLYQGYCGLWVPTQLGVGKHIARHPHVRRVLQSFLLKAESFKWVHTCILLSLWCTRPKQVLRWLLGIYLSVCTKYVPILVKLSSRNSTLPWPNFLTFAAKLQVFKSTHSTFCSWFFL